MQNSPLRINLDEYNAKSTSKLYESLYFCMAAILLTYRLQKNKLKKIKRDYEIVKKEYDQKNWKEIFENKEWLQFKSLHDYIFQIKKNGKDLQKVKIKALVDSKLYNISQYDYYKFRPMTMLNILKEFVADDEKIVELGCGYGFNIFSLIVLNLKNKFEGYDISKNAIDAANKITKQFNCDVTFGIYDMTKPFRPNLLTKKSVFTYYAFEQLKYKTEKVIKNIIDQKPNQVLHFEPIIELYSNEIRDVASKLYLKAQDYQDNLLKTLRMFESKKKLKITHVKRLGYSRNPLIEGSFVRWVPVMIKN